MVIIPFLGDNWYNSKSLKREREEGKLPPEANDHLCWISDACKLPLSLKDWMNVFEDLHVWLQLNKYVTTDPGIYI